MDIDPAFVATSVQIDEAAERLCLAPEELEVLKRPSRYIGISILHTTSDGHLTAFPAFRVQYPNFFGPNWGGLTYSPRLSLGLTAARALRLASQLSFLNIPLSGSFGGICCNGNDLSRKELIAVTTAYVAAFRPLLGPESDILTHDRGTNETVIMWAMRAISGKTDLDPLIATGKPRRLGGIPTTRVSASVAVRSIMEVIERLGLRKDRQLTAVVNIYDDFGSALARLLKWHKLKIIAIGDESGVIADSRGVDLDEADSRIRSGLSLVPEAALSLSAEEMLRLPCDVLVVGGEEGLITRAMAPRLNCRVLAEMAPGVVSNEADWLLQDRADVFVLPEILCGSGWAISGYLERSMNLLRKSWTMTEIVTHAEMIATAALTQVFKASSEDRVSLRSAALSIALSRMAAAVRAERDRHWKKP